MSTERFQHMLGSVRRAAADYGMINPGDKVAVGLSGGKDSVLLLAALAELRRFEGFDFELCAITVEAGFPGMDFSGTTDMCERLFVPYYTEKTDIGTLVFDVRQESSPCSLCAKLRRGALCAKAQSLGCNTLALGHNFDDVVETFMLNLIYGGRLATFEPATYLPEHSLSVIRPFSYVREHEAERLARELELPVVKNTCPADKKTEREKMKALLLELEHRYRGLRGRIFGSIERAGLCGWHENPRGRKT